MNYMSKRVGLLHQVGPTRRVSEGDLNRLSTQLSCRSKHFNDSLSELIKAVHTAEKEHKISRNQ